MKLPVGYVAGHGVHKATAYGGFGQRMMEKMGWEKGEGLGKEKSGMKEAIEVKKKEDQLGVGANHQGWNWNLKFWEEAYNSAVSAVNHETSSSSSDSSSDEDEPAGRGRRPARGGKAAAAKVVHRDGTVASVSEAELKIAAELAKDPWGRWGGRGGKMARIKQQEEAMANEARNKLLGAKGAAGGTGLPSSSKDSESDVVELGSGSAQKLKASKRKRGSSSSSSSSSGSDESSDSDSDSGSRGKGKEGKKQKAASPAKGEGAAKGDESAPKKKPLVVILGSKAEREKERQAVRSLPRTPATGWWGSTYFISAGFLEGMQDEEDEDSAEAQARRKRNAFTEDDQAALYMQVHDHQRQGRKGLGKSTRLKIAGGAWEGQKKTFEEEGSDDEAAVAAPAAADSDADDDAEAAAAKKKARKEAKRKAKKAAAEEAEEEAQAAADGIKAKKSKKRKTAAKQQQDGSDDDDDDEKTAAAGSGKAQEEEAGPSAAAAGFKLLKAAKAILKEEPLNRLKLARMAKRLAKQAAGSGVQDMDAEAVQAALTKKAAKKGSKLCIEGKYLMLRGAQQAASDE